MKITSTECLAGTVHSSNRHDIGVEANVCHLALRTIACPGHPTIIISLNTGTWS